MNCERKEEKWFTYFRHKCKEGFIDEWMGDSIDDPNNDAKSMMNLNSFTTYYRLNGEGKWIKRNEFNSLKHNIVAYSNDFSSQYIWDESKRKDFDNVR